ncbi:MAG: hypothetical protein KGL39_43530 [Patescibacteria group bacterium]|nr:hypothetical protein [Patescibacteria group bacterium]
MRAVDPIHVMRMVALDDTFSPEQHLDPLLLEGIGGRESAEISQVAIEAARRHFGVKAWSEDCPGLTEQETLQLWQTFAEYLDALKKNTNGSPMTAASMDPTSSDWQDSTTTSVSSDFTSTAPEPSNAEPALS